MIRHRQMTSWARAVLSADPWMTVWAATPVELTSAIWQRQRAGEIDEEQRMAAQVQLADLERSWQLVTDLYTTVRAARRLLSIHSLRAGDALQLAAGLIAYEQEPGEFVTLDVRLQEAASREGFTVITV